MNPFEYINVIMEKKGKPESLSDYSIFIVNRGLSMIPNLVPIATYLSSQINITPEMHFDFLYNFLPKQKSYFKWVKQNKKVDEYLDFVIEYYGVSKKKALEYLRILTPENLEEIKSYFFFGGLEQKGKKKAT